MLRIRTPNPTSDLFTQYVQLNVAENALLLHSDDLKLAHTLVEQVKPEGSVTALHTSYRVLNQLAHVPGLMVSNTVYPTPTAHGSPNIILLDIPKGRDHFRAYLWTAAQTLQPGGKLYLAGLNAAGARSAIKDAGVLFGNVVVLGYQSRCRIALATRPDEELSIPKKWGKTPPWQPQMRVVIRPEREYIIVTMPGVFSWDHLDDGTALLLDHLAVESDTAVLDMGCGYGIIGLVAAQAGARVTLVDDDLLAVRCARASVQANDLAERCTVLPSDITSAIGDRKFDLILSNPPFHQDIAVTTAIANHIIRAAVECLGPGGRLRIVANRFLAHNRIMHDRFGNVTTVADNARYHVLESVR